MSGTSTKTAMPAWSLLRVIGVLAACAFGPTAVAATQSHPATLQNPAQRTQRYYEQQQAPPPQQPVNPLPQTEPPAAPTAPGKVHALAGFVLRGVEFTQSALLNKAELQAAVRPYVGHKVDQADLDAMLGRINDLYRQRNITTARALLRNQTVVHGVVHIELVEGKLGKLDIEGAHHIRASFIRGRIHQQQHQVVDSDRLRKDLVYLNQTTDLEVRALLMPGAARGQTNIRLAVQEPNRHSIDAFVDDGGVDSTGRYRVGIQGHLYGLLGIDDQLIGNIAYSRGGTDGAVSYSVPVFTSNGRLGVSYAHSQINIVDDAFRDLDVRGTSSVTSLTYRQPFLATMHWQFNGIGAYSITDSTTSISGQQIADTSSRSITLGASVAHQKDGQRWSITQLVTRLRSDEPMLGQTSFTTAPGSAYIIQRLGKSRWALRADAGWQWLRGKNLPSANLFQVGGTGSVRGYQRGVLSGPSGYYLDLELHRSFSERLDVFVFIDHGQVSAFYPNKDQITGAGLGGIYRRGWLSLSADIAKPFKTAIPNQDSVRVDFRLSAHFY